SSPSADCVEVGRIEAREATELLSSPDVLTAAAIEQLRIRAARRGATHVVVAESPMTGMVSYTTTARAEGLAVRCPPPAGGLGWCWWCRSAQERETFRRSPSAGNPPHPDGRLARCRE